MNCPTCDSEMEYEEYDPSVGILRGGYFCEACNEFIGEDELDDEPDVR